MRHQAATILDEFVPANSTTWTSTEFNARLGANDQLAVHAVVDNVTVSGTVSIWVEHSGDGRNWIQRNDQKVTTTAPGDITGTATAGTAYSVMWADPCYTVMGAAVANSTSSGNGAPLLPFVRFKVTTSGGAAAHVKLHVALRGPR